VIRLREVTAAEALIAEHVIPLGANCFAVIEYWEPELEEWKIAPFDRLELPKYEPKPNGIGAARAALKQRAI
jgi:transposase